MKPRIKLLEIILSPNYKGMSTRKLTSLVHGSDKYTKSELAYIRATVGQLIRLGFLQDVGKTILPTDTTVNYYNLITNPKYRKPLL